MALMHRDRHLVEWPTVSWPEWWRRWMDLEPAGWLRTEEFYDGDTLVVRAETPGIDPDKDVDISVAGGVVTIKVHREEKAEHKGKRGYRSEFRYGEFVRELDLPQGLSADDVKASYSNGILEVRVPRAAEQEAGGTKVPITRS